MFSPELSGARSQDGQPLRDVLSLREVAVTLLFVADPELRTDLTRPIFGRSVLRRNIERAHSAGFERVAALPGICEEVEGLTVLSVGEPLPGPVVIVLEGSSVTASLLNLLRSSLEDDWWGTEGRSVYDGEGRPALYLGAERKRVPGRMPIAPSAELPQRWEIDPQQRADPSWRLSHDPGDAVVRMVEDRDRQRVRAQLMREVGLPPQRFWHRWVSSSLLRGLSYRQVTLAQWELAAVVAGLAGAALITVDRWWSLVLGIALSWTAIEVAILLPRWVQLVQSSQYSSEVSRTRGLLESGRGVAGALRPAIHAALLLALGYAWVIDEQPRLRFLHLSVAELTVLSVSAAGALVLLAHARAQLRGGGWGQDLVLARFDRFLERVGIAAPWSRNEFALLELVLLVAALSGQPLAMWWILLVASASRLWRWALRPVPRDTPSKSP